MKQLLEQLQSFPKTWERFELFTKNILDVYFLHQSVIDNDLFNYGNKAILGQLLTDFCDGEGYWTAVNIASNGYNKFRWQVYTISKFDIIEIIEDENEDKVWLSRQEAFNQGVVKCFELMENKGDK